MFPWWIMMLTTFSYTSWPFRYLLLWRVSVQVFCPEFVCFKLSMLCLSTYLFFLCILFFPRVFYFYVGLLSFSFRYFLVVQVCWWQILSVFVWKHLYMAYSLNNIFIGYRILVWQLFFQYFKDDIPLSSSFHDFFWISLFLLLN